MNVRLARVEEFAELARHLGDTVELTPGRVWVAEEEGVLMGVAPLRLCWQLEPLMILPAAKQMRKITRCRAALMMYLAAENWVASPENRFGPRWLFAVTRSSAVKAWSKRLGWRRIYSGAAMFLKHLPPTL